MESTGNKNERTCRGNEKPGRRGVYKSKQEGLSQMGEKIWAQGEIRRQDGGKDRKSETRRENNEGSGRIQVRYRTETDKVVFKQVDGVWCCQDQEVDF